MKPYVFTATLLNPQQLNLAQRAPTQYSVTLSGVTSTTDISIAHIGSSGSEYWICNQTGGKAFKLVSVQSVVGIPDQLNCTIQDVGLFNYKADSYSYNIPVTGKCYVVEVKGTIPAIYAAPDIERDFDPKWTSELLSRILHEHAYDLSYSPTGPAGPIRDIEGNLKGYKGELGDTGVMGRGGEKGSTGDTGPLGYSWEGEIGRIGDKGPTNTMPSDSGPRGETGLDGATGSRGHTGGITGPTGDRGETGPDGPQGRLGPTGIRGPTGDRGETGYDGPIGPTGPTGPRGHSGDRGETGPFVYYSASDHLTLEEMSITNNKLQYRVNFTPGSGNNPPINVNNNNLGTVNNYYKNINSNILYSPSIIGTHTNAKISSIDTTIIGVTGSSSSIATIDSVNDLTIDVENLHAGTRASNNTTSYLLSNFYIGGPTGYGYITTNSNADLVVGYTGANGDTGVVYFPTGINATKPSWKLTANTMTAGIVNLSNNALKYTQGKYDILHPTVIEPNAFINFYNRTTLVARNILDVNDLYANNIYLKRNYDQGVTGTNVALIDMEDVFGSTGSDFIRTTNIMARSYMTKGMTTIFSSTVSGFTTTNLGTVYDNYGFAAAYITYPKLNPDARFDTVTSSRSFFPIRKYLSVQNYKLNINFRFFITKYDSGINVFSTLFPLSTNGMPQQMHGLTYNVFTPYRASVNPVPISQGRYVVNGSFSTMLCNSYNINGTVDSRGGFRPLYPYTGVTPYTYDDFVLNLERNTNYWLAPLGVRIYISGTTSNTILLNDGVGVTGSSALRSYIHHNIEPVTVLLT